ncbi:MAG: shikimate dehydrogenase [Sphingorhabdus sp.]|nr:shikimate dehydrogenase [Sphingorhabdus sp.]
MTNNHNVYLTGLIGRSIGASRSPAIHSAAAASLNVTLAYRLVDFETLGWADSELPRAVAMLRQLGFAGCNVTFPFKQQAIALCDSLGREAEMIGAVNSLVFADGRVHGENTDWQGFSWMLSREFGDIAGTHIAQIGAGGAGSATALALAQHNVEQINLFDPERGRAEALISRLSPFFPAVRFVCAPDAAAAIGGCDGIVNATPVGMAAIPGTPFTPKLMAGEQWVADIIYFPLETELLRYARQNGQRTANGVSMVAGQAAAAFQMFTGHTPDRNQMLDRLMNDISKEQTAPGLAA